MRDDQVGVPFGVVLHHPVISSIRDELWTWQILGNFCFITITQLMRSV